MKLWTRMLALLVAVVMTAALLVGCSNSSGNTSAPSDEPAADTTTGNDNAADAEDGEEPETPAEDEDEEEEEDIAEITFYTLVSAGKADDVSKVEKAINAITEEKIHTHVSLNAMAIGDYIGKMPLMMAGNEKIDVLVRGFGPLGFGALYANHQLMDITDLLEPYAPDVLAKCGDLLEAFRIDGRIYAIPTYRQLNNTCFITMRQDMIDEMGIQEQVDSMTTWAEYEQVLETVKQNYDTIYPLALFSVTEGTILCGDKFSDAVTYDSVGDTIRVIGGFEDGSIQKLYWDDRQIEHFERYADWMDKGYIWPDSAYAQMMSQEVIAQGVAFGDIVTSEMGIEAAREAVTGYKTYAKPLVNTAIGTDQVNKFGLAVNANCEEPEAAMKFINLLYSDAELMNLIIFGIEGENYVVDEEGIANFPDGTAASTNYHLDDFTFGDQFLLLPWAGNAADFREKSKEAFENAPVSNFLGFTLDTTGLDNQIAAVSAIQEQYQYQIWTGGYTPKLMDEIRSSFEAAGIDDYYNAIVEQVEAWRAE